MSQKKTGRIDRRKIMAVGAGALVLGVGATATLAGWIDTEWVFGGNGAGGPGIGTSTFEVQQSTVAPFTSFTDRETNPGGEIVFTPDALSLAPGVTTYAAMALRTTADSTRGEVELQQAVPATGVTVNDPDGLLFAALEVAVATDDAPFTCDTTAFAGDPDGPVVIADGSLSTSGGTSAQELEAAGGSTQYYCFALSLPQTFTPVAPATVDDYMGLTVTPAWEFVAESIVD